MKFPSVRWLSALSSLSTLKVSCRLRLRPLATRPGRRTSVRAVDHEVRPNVVYKYGVSLTGEIGPELGCGMAAPIAGS